MNWKAFQQLKVKDVPVWSLDLLFIPVLVIVVEWFWFVRNRPGLALGAAVVVIVVRQVTRHIVPPRGGRNTENR